MRLAKFIFQSASRIRVISAYLLVYLQVFVYYLSREPLRLVGLNKVQVKKSATF